jgi:hypothetical protein
MNTPSNDQELHRLFTAKADGVITPEDHDRLSTLLKESADIRRQWFAFQDAEAALLSWSLRESVLREVGMGLEARSHRDEAGQTGFGGWRYAGAVAAGIAIALFAWAYFWPGAGENPSAGVAARDEATTSSVAVLSRGVNMEWDRAVAAPALNAPLPPGDLRLQSGIAEIEFFQGARLCVEGPAEIRLVSAGEVYCKSGRFSAHVPPQARGFRIGTPKGDIVDLGTDFGLDLDEAAPELHVFKGEVELHQPKTPMRMLTTGNAAALEPASNRTLVANVAAFAFSQDLDARVSASRREAFARWQAASARWNADPAARLRFDFQDSAESRSLRNAALQGGDIAAGTIVGCNWTEGRWPGKSALQFRSVSDRVRLNIPGEYRHLTLAAWVQLHSLSARQSQSSLCMSQGLQAGGVHWQVLADGSICLGLVASTQPKITDDYISPIVFTPERFGQWIHLAAVLDNEAQEVRFYVNGKRLSAHPLKRSPTVATPSMAELGNWIPSNYHGKHPVRNFVGCMDDFLLLARALNDEEVRQVAE